ncbi:MAG: hypothetical protein IMW99_08110 [Firmicutes bacterium]|nr:hypothetical protein [Bacillota bacterium]
MRRKYSLRGLQAASPAGRGPAPAGPGQGEAGRPEGPNLPGEDRQAQWLIRQVRKQLSRLFALVDMAESLRQAGLTQADLRWIAEHEMANRPAYGIPARPATQEELLEVLEAAWS